MAGIASKLSDCDWVKYVEQFDFVTLVETFVDNTFDLSVFFGDYVKFVCPVSSCHTKGDEQEVLWLWLRSISVSLWKELVSSAIM